MTERKPAGVPVESFIDRQIREAQERGEFDNLPGEGKPLRDIDQPYDELWWVRRKLKDEGLSYLPPSLQLRRDVEKARAAIDDARSERQVREIVQEMNTQIRHVNRTLMHGPASTVTLLDEDAEVERWRRARD